MSPIHNPACARGHARPILTAMPSPAEALSTALFRETRGTRFFGVLAGRNAAFYVDTLDELEQEILQ